jgi:uncharacterized protein (DUF2141 family)
MIFFRTPRAITVAAVLAVMAAAPAMARAQVARTPVECLGEPSATRLHIVIRGARSNDGVMTATLYGDDPHKFLKSGGDLKVWRYPAKAPITEQCVYLPKPGSYAVAVYHDAKRTYRFTQGAFGMPTQDYGFTRDARIFFGPPSLASAKFPAAEGDTTVIIRLRYP